MESEWQQITLGEFITLQRGHDLPLNKRKIGTIPILGSFGITGWHDKSKTQGPGVTIGRSGGSMGVVSFSHVDYWPLNTALYVNDFHDNHPRFAYYFLKSIDFSRYNSGSAQASLNRNYIHPIQISVPFLPEQKAIAHVLGSLDDRIELNRRMNETLEGMAQALFKSWFVDFDPVFDNALASGKEIPPELKEKRELRKRVKGEKGQSHPLPKEIRSLFPDKFTYSDELGWIPKGWEVTVLKKLTSKIGSGATPRGGKKVYQEEGTALIRSQNVYDSKFVWAGLARISDEAATQLVGVTVLEGDVLLNITGASILRTCVVIPGVLPARVNQHVAIIRAKQDIPPCYLHLHLLQQRTKGYLLGLNAGGSREAVTKGHIESVPILNPSKKLFQQFQNITVSIYAKANQLESEIRSLAKLRNTLLPKLLSGEIRIPNAEKMVEDLG